MYYFVGNNLGTTLTGIEKAQLNRLKLFNNYNLDAKCVFVTYNPVLHENAEKFGVNSDVFSIYDYFQHTIDYVPSHFDWLTYWTEECNYEIKYIPKTKDIRIYSNNNYIMYAHFSDTDYKYVKYINYFDDKHRKIKREIFDSRGFLSCIKYLTTKQKILFEHYLDAEGNTVIEKYYDPEAEKHTLTRIVVKDCDGRAHYLRSRDELLTLFTNQIHNDSDIFFSDKNNVTAQGLVNSHHHIPIVGVLHSTHLKYKQDAELKNIKNTYKNLFNNLDRFSGLITSTLQQKTDVETLVGELLPVWNIPVGYVERRNDAEESLSSEPLRLISIARYAVEKQLDHQIRLVKRLKVDIDNVELHMFGAGPEHAKLSAQIKDEGLTDHIFLRGFVTDLSVEYKKSHVNLLTSRMEGFSLALLEASSYGVPSVSYDIEYGPREIIENGESGYLVSLDDEEGLYEHVKTLLIEPGKQQKFKEATLKSVNRYSEAELIEKWRYILSQI